MRKKILIFTLAALLFGGFLFFAHTVLAQYDGGLSNIAEKAKLNKSADLPTLSGQVLGAALSFVGVIFLLLMVYGGILWMTARGNSQQTDKAMNIIISATIGLIIVLGSYAITKFLFDTVDKTGSGSSCANAIPGLGEGKLCASDDDCTSIDPGLRCNNNTPRICQAANDSFCNTKCGQGFSCNDSTNCSGGITQNYCSGGNNIVCCLPKQ